VPFARSLHWQSFASASYPGALASTACRPGSRK
jgi:hypothetical protein